jgi:hypothetical protein
MILKITLLFKQVVEDYVMNLLSIYYDDSDSTWLFIG